MDDPKEEFESKPKIDEMMNLASAIAARELQEMDYVRGMTGIGIKPSDPAHQDKLLIDGTIRNLLRIQYPDDGGYLVQLVDQEMEATYVDIAQEVYFRTGKRMSVEAARDMVRDRAIMMMNDVGQTEEQSAKDFAKLLSGSQIVAALYGVPVAEVYKTDELFAEAHRTMYSIDEFAMRFIDQLSMFTVQSMTQIKLQDFKLSSTPDPREDEYVQKISQNAEFRDSIVKTVLEKRSIVQNTARAYLERIWGYDAMMKLPDKIKNKLSI